MAGQTAVGKLRSEELERRLALARSGSLFAPKSDQKKRNGLKCGPGTVLRFMTQDLLLGRSKVATVLVIAVASDEEMKADGNRQRLSTQPLHILEDHQTIYRMGRVYDPQHGFRLVPDSRHNRLDRYNFTAGNLEGVPKGDGVMDQLLAGFVKTVEEEGMKHAMRRDLGSSTRSRAAASAADPYTCPTDGVSGVLSDSDDGSDDGRVLRHDRDPSKVQEIFDDGSDSAGSVACVDPPARPAARAKRGGRVAQGRKVKTSANQTAPRAGAAGDPLDLVGEQRPGQKQQRKKQHRVKPKGTSKAASEDSLQPASGESEDDGTTRKLDKARIKVSKEQRKKLVTMSKTTGKKRKEERDTALAASREAEKKRAVRAARAKDAVAAAKLARDEKADAKDAAVAEVKDDRLAKGKKGGAKSAEDAEEPAATSAPSAAKGKGRPKKAAASSAPLAAKGKNRLNKTPPGTKKPAATSAPPPAKRQKGTHDQAPGLSAAERALLSHLLEKQMSSEAAKPASKGNGTDEPSGGHDGDDGGEDEVADSDGGIESDDPEGTGEDAAAEDEDPPLEHFRACVAALKPWPKAILKDLRTWRKAHTRLQLTRDDHDLKCTEIQNNSKDNKGNVIPALVPGCSMPTAARWIRMIQWLDSCHDLECCSESSNVKEALKRHDYKE